MGVCFAIFRLVSFFLFLFYLFIVTFLHIRLFFFVRFFCMRVKKKEKAEIIVVLYHSL